MRVHIPSPLRSYTNNQSTVEASGSTLRDVLKDLNDSYPGIRFRMIDEQDRTRPHIRIFVNKVMVSDLSTSIEPGHEVRIVAALSGG